jgi:hypothetical protein
VSVFGSTLHAAAHWLSSIVLHALGQKIVVGTSRTTAVFAASAFDSYLFQQTAMREAPQLFVVMRNVCSQFFRRPET